VSRTAILNVDGTLVDSSESETLAWLDAFREAGFDNVAAETVRLLVGMTVSTLVPCAVGLNANGPAGRRIVARRREFLAERYLDRIKPFPEVEGLLHRLRADGFLLVASSSSGDRGELERLLRIGGLLPLVDQIMPAEEAEPWAGGAAVEIVSLGCTRETAVMVADTPYDVHAARNAGVDMIALRAGRWDDLSLLGATAIYDDPADLLAHYTVSPFARLGQADPFVRRASWRKRYPVSPLH